MIKALNPWLILGALLAILVSSFGGVIVGKKLERTAWLEREQELQKLAEQETVRANEIAKLYGTSLSTSQDTAFNLRRKLNEQRDQLASCIPGGGVRLSGGFVSLFNDALQADAENPIAPAGEAAGTDPVELAEVSIENGRRWKACRLQLNSLIDILEHKK